MQTLRIQEFELALDTDAPYAIFRKNIQKIRNDLRAFLLKAKKQKKLVHGYGASTKGNTILQYAGITPDLMAAVADRNPVKWGSYTIGSNIPIIAEAISYLPGYNVRLFMVIQAPSQLREVYGATLGTPPLFGTGNSFGKPLS